MVSLTMLLYASADRLAILTFLGTEQLGFYSVAYLASSTISLVPATISQLHYPKLALLFGNSARVADLGTFVEQPAFASRFAHHLGRHGRLLAVSRTHRVLDARVSGRDSLAPASYW